MDLFEVVYHRPLRPCGKIMFEGLNAGCWSFSQRFHCPVRTVSNITHNLMPSRSALREEPVTHSLHITSYQELSRYARLHVDRRLLLFTLEQVRFFPLLKRERFVVETFKLQRQRHRVAVDRSDKIRRLRFRLLVGAYRSAAFGRVCSTQLEPPVSIDNQRPLNRSMRAIILNRRRLLSDLNTNMISTPRSGRNSLHISRTRARNQEDNYKNTDSTDA